MRDFILSILKICFFVVIIPIVLATTMALRQELLMVSSVSQEYFYLGIIVYIFVYLFVYDFKEFHLTAQNIATEMFKLIPAVDRLAPYFFPVYCLFTLVAYAFFGRLLKIGPGLEYYFGVLGFTLALHVVMTAREFYDDDKRVWKPNYFFSLSLSYIATVFVVVLVVDWIIADFSFAHFFHLLYQSTNNTYEDVFRYFWKFIKKF